MKKFALFLPQFHEIIENNEWWGKGFTEWTNVKDAKPIFRGHNQPVIPLNDNYYNLLDKETVIWQTDLLHKFHLDGLIYYHYYFDGKLLMEKPAENLLKWTEIDQSFFFCWGNHSFTRSWNNSREILIKQTYGNENSWENHFQYLLPFFLDSRYEKKDNKPLFMIFKSDFEEKKNLFSYFNQRCIDYGFKGLCLIETLNTWYWDKEIALFEKNLADVTEYIYLREPGVSEARYMRKIRYTPMHLKYKIWEELQKHSLVDHLFEYNGRKLYKTMIGYSQIKTYKKQKIIPGVFFGWDNSPRHKKRGTIVSPPTKKLFFRYMNNIKGADYIFINAWNEWAEGMMLEPSVNYGYKYLEWIKEWTET